MSLYGMAHACWKTIVTNKQIEYISSTNMAACVTFYVYEPFNSFIISISLHEVVKILTVFAEINILQFSAVR